MGEFNLTIFDLEENGEYEGQDGERYLLVGRALKRRGGTPQAWSSDFELDVSERFREIKPRKKLYAYLNMSTVAMFGEIYRLMWSEDHSLSETRMPEFDREIE